MKIKLVTFAPHPNFGTCLQSYALNRVLREMGHDVEFIYNRRENPPLTFRRHVRALCGRVLRAVLSERRFGRLKGKMARAAGRGRAEGPPTPAILRLPDHRLLGFLSRLPGYGGVAKRWYYGNAQKRKVYKFTFRDGNFKMRRLFTRDDYARVVEDADLFVTGSDQIWNPFCGGYNPMMFLEFVGEGTRRVAYASSVSLTEIPACVEGRMREALRKFSHIAVRERRSVELLGGLLRRGDIRQVVDPTFLLPAEEWEKFGERAEIGFEVPDEYVFCYFVGDKRAEVYERMVRDVKRLTGIGKVISLECCGRRRIYGGGVTCRDAGPYEWVSLLRRSSYVCMDSFHATVFALKFRKEFAVALKDGDAEAGSQNTRMYDILSRYGLLHKIYKDGAGGEWRRRVDYSRITPLVERDTKDSMDYLRIEIEGRDGSAPR